MRYVSQPITEVANFICRVVTDTGSPSQDATRCPYRSIANSFGAPGKVIDLSQRGILLGASRLCLILVPTPTICARQCYALQ